ncbi:MAG: endolytic transglycosylase MltG [Patescibacteria group bacterium]
MEQTLGEQPTADTATELTNSATGQTIDKEEEKAVEKLPRTAFLASLGIENRSAKIVLTGALGIVFFATLISFLLMPPRDFPKDKTITVRSGVSLGQVSLLLKDEHLIRSRTLFELCSRAVGGDKPILAGQYLFKDSAYACTIAMRIARGISGIPSVRVTIPEGMSNKEVAVVIAKLLPGFDSAFFLENARQKEGYLFPDTYLLSTSVNTEKIVSIMSANFEKKIESWIPIIESSGRSLRDTIIMASILEKEATTDEDKELVSGILWKRIKIGMPLQVDATFMYLFNKKSSDITQADLQMKSVYNTYRNKGLPGGPIGNPGIAAIRAAIRPKDSPYLYYLSDDKGVMHYAKTFAEHVVNKGKYLR